MSAYGRLCTKAYDLSKPLSCDAELEFYKSHLSKNDLILEPMCGSGRVLIPLLQAGFTIHGSDNSKYMLESCKNKIENFSLPQTKLYEMSIEDLKSPYQYNAILIPFGSFQLLSRSQAYLALKNIKRLLLPKGKLFLDLFVPWEALYQNPDEKFSKEFIIDDNYVIKQEGYNKSNKYEQYFVGESTFSEVVNGKVTMKEQERITITWYYKYEMELILEKFGFENIIYQEMSLSQEGEMQVVYRRSVSISNDSHILQ